MRHPRRAGLVLAALTTAVSLVAPAQAAVPSVELQPHRLSRGADIAVPHIDDGDFVDGARRTELPGTVARILGPSVVDLLRTLDPSTVRCTLAACENATDPVKVQTP